MSNLRDLLNVITEPKIYIQMHNYPDQDAIASAFGLQRILEYNHIQSVLCYHGTIDKVDTLKMIELLGIEAFELSNCDMKCKDQIIVIDGQVGNANVEVASGYVIACIDHHPVFEEQKYLYNDIRSEFGACATIITSYYLEEGLCMDWDVATALLYGIKIDTCNLTRRVSYPDIDAFSYLYKLADLLILDKFYISILRKDDLLAYQDGISNLVIREEIGITQLLDNCSEAMIGTIADFIVTLEEVRLSVVYAYRDGGIKFSIRSDIKEIDAGKLIRYALCNLGDGGGHDRVAAGFIPEITTKESMDSMVNTVIYRIEMLVKEGVL